MTSLFALLTAATLTQAPLAVAPNVGRGHFAVELSGNLELLFAASSGVRPLQHTDLRAGAGYFVTDWLLLGAGLAASCSVCLESRADANLGTTLQPSAQAQAWFRLTPSAYAVAGLDGGFGWRTYEPADPLFARATGSLGLALFANDWLALQPELFVELNANDGQAVRREGLRFGLHFLL